MTVTACLIARNEAACLPATLASLRAGPIAQRLVTEIVLVDTGSTDRTPEIAAEFGCRVLSVPWRHDFSHARNAALSAARGAFCLIIDADEQVDPGTWPAFSSFIEAGTFARGRALVISQTSGGPVAESGIRVCRNDGIARYVGRVHEQLIHPGHCGDSGLRLLHSGYTAEAIAGKDKPARNLALLQLDLADHPEDPYLHYQVGRTTWQDRPHEAVPHFQTALRMLAETGHEDAPYVPSLVRELGYALKACGRAREALDLVRRFRERLPGFTDLVFLEGLLHMELGQAGPMLEAFTLCLRLGEPRGYGSTVQGVGTFRAHTNLGLFYELAGRPDIARGHYQAALRACPDFAAAAEGLSRLPPISEPGRGL